MSEIDIFNTANKYGVIYADPPWDFKTRSDRGRGRSADNHYPIPDFETLRNLPVQNLAAKDAVLLMWVTDPHLEIGLGLMKDWGFTYKTVGFYWAKEKRKSDGFFTGMGYWTRANPEQCILGTRGNPSRLAKDVKKLVVSKLREHSRKPDEIRDSIRRLVPGPYLEMFARSTDQHWDSWGNQVGVFDTGE